MHVNFCHTLMFWYLDEGDLKTDVWEGNNYSFPSWQISSEGIPMSGMLVQQEKVFYGMKFILLLTDWNVWLVKNVSFGTYNFLWFDALLWVQEPWWTRLSIQVVGCAFLWFFQAQSPSYGTQVVHPKKLFPSYSLNLC